MKRLGRPPKSLTKSKLEPTPTETVSSRVGGRERKAKKVFDPSENNTPKKRAKGSKSTDRGHADSGDSKYKAKSDSKSSSPKSKYLMEEYCSICNKEEKKLKTLINCNDCNLKAHTECLATKFGDRKLLESKWRCDNCKTCAICYETEEIGALITCSICINSYHITCHVPKVNAKSVNFEDWRCTKCPLAPAVTKQPLNQTQAASKPASIAKSASVASPSNSILSLTSENSSSSSSFSSAAATPTATSTEAPLKNQKTNKFAAKVTVKQEILDDIKSEPKEIRANTGQIYAEKLESDEVPDISSWSCEKLSSFMQKIFPNETKLLREQEVDGQSLLLMTRTDVLSLGLKLGPALRLYNFIVGLQTRKYDDFATWIY